LTALRGVKVFRRGDRLSDLVSQLTLYLDMQTIAVNAVADRSTPPGPRKGHCASLVSTLFGVLVQMPIYFHFAASFNPALAAPVEIKIVDGGMPPGLDEYTSQDMVGTSLMIWNMALVFFYEQQLDGMRAKFGKRRDSWPEIARFAWALRNAAAHNGALHFTSADARPVQWHHLRYDARDNGKKVIGDIMKPADVLIFLIEFADELDRIGIPLPG
jgi:hypothetical protein